MLSQPPNWSEPIEYTCWSSAVVNDIVDPETGKLTEYAESHGYCEDTCYICTYLEELVGYCCVCDHGWDKEHLWYDHPAGEYYCPECRDEHMPKEKTSFKYYMCEVCGERYLREKEGIENGHEHFKGKLRICQKCVDDSYYDTRWEIIDI